MSAEPLLTVENVSLTIGGYLILNDVNLQVASSEIVALIGPNGAGKSTFMKILAGDLEPDAGVVSRPEKTSVLRKSSTPSRTFASSTW